MNKFIKLIALNGLIAAIVLTGCGKIEEKRPAQYEVVREVILTVKCYSNGILIHEGQAKGSPTFYNSGEVVFIDPVTGKQAAITGHCVFLPLPNS